MAKWVETYRGTVAPWECDITEHFTIAYYADRIDQASTGLAEEVGLLETLATGGFARQLRWRFLRELRAGASFHIESAPIGLAPDLRLGHKILDSANAEVVTWTEETWEDVRLPEAARQAVDAAVAAWEGPAAEPRPDPTTLATAVATARGRVRASELVAWGRFSLAAFVHRFTDANIQALAAIGLTADYIKTERRGYSTFELLLRIAAVPRIGDRLLVETGITHLGNSSIRFLHRMLDPRSGHEFARLGQFGVQLDLDARRPAPLAAAIRGAAENLLLSTS